MGSGRIGTRSAVEPVAAGTEATENRTVAPHSRSLPSLFMACLRFGLSRRPTGWRPPFMGKQRAIERNLVRFLASRRGGRKPCVATQSARKRTWFRTYQTIDSAFEALNVPPGGVGQKLGLGSR